MSEIGFHIFSFLRIAYLNNSPVYRMCVRFFKLFIYLFSFSLETRPPAATLPPSWVSLPVGEKCKIT